MVVEAAVEIVVALHLRAFAGDDADGAAEAAGTVGAEKPWGVDEHQPARAGRSARATGIGDTLDRKRRIFRGERRIGQRFRRDLGRIEKLEIADVLASRASSARQA